MASPAEQNNSARPLRRVAAAFVWLALWQLLAAVVNNPLILAGPVETLAAFARLAAQAQFWAKIAWSLVRIAAGFSCGFVLALVLAWLASRSDIVEDLLHPFMLAVKSIPVVCIVVLLLVWFGSRIVSAISVFLVVLPAVYFSALEAIRALDADTDEMLELYRVSAMRRMLAFVWPSMQPFLLATSEMVVGMSWKAGVAAELIGTPAGSIGERIYQAKILLETADLFAWTIVVVFMAWLCERAFLALLRASGEWSLHAAIPTAASTRPRYTPRELSCTGLSASFDGEPVFRGVSHSFAAGSRTALRDPSGAGKTTFLRVLAGLVRPDAGSATKERCSFAFQEPRLIDALNAHDNLALVAGDSLSAAQIDALLAQLLPREVLAQKTGELSGGQRRRVELARALAYASEAVLLDEPFVSLDEDAYKDSVRFVSENLDGRTLIIATHNEDDAALLAAEEVRLFT